MPGKLTDAKLRNLRATGKIQKIADGEGLYIHVTPSGSKLWRIAYRFGGKQKLFSLGDYPAVSLRDARAKLVEVKSVLSRGLDPNEKKKEDKRVAAASKIYSQSFEEVARAWIQSKIETWRPSHAKTVIQRLEHFVFPDLGNHPIAELRAPDFLACLRKIEARGRLDLAKRTARICGQVTFYARACGIVDMDVASGLAKVIASRPRKHFAAITNPIEVGELLRSIDVYGGEYVTRYALKILAYTFVRSGELRNAQWSEVNLERGIWLIPPEHTKRNLAHVVPLARQVIFMFNELRRVTGDRDLIFPSPHSRTAPLSDMGLLNALRRMDYGRDKMTVHGFRAMASTLLNEKGYPRDVIELQLAHNEKDAVRSAYNHSEHMPERQRMMQDWADYLDTLRNATN